jgi:hypothetical protein
MKKTRDAINVMHFQGCTLRCLCAAPLIVLNGDIPVIIIQRDMSYMMIVLTHNYGRHRNTGYKWSVKVHIRAPVQLGQRVSPFGGDVSFRVSTTPYPDAYAHLDGRPVRGQARVLERLLPRHDHVLDHLVHAVLELLSNVSRAVEALSE